MECANNILTQQLTAMGWISWMRQPKMGVAGDCVLRLTTQIMGQKHQLIAQLYKTRQHCLYIATQRQSLAAEEYLLRWCWVDAVCQLQPRLEIFNFNLLFQSEK